MSIKYRKYPWIAQQTWNHILFIHYPVDKEVLASHLPHPFKVDLYEGKAWLSFVIFQATNSRLRYMPQILSYPKFLQLNVRTYVQGNNEPGVYFFSIHTNNYIVKKGGHLFSLPFQLANMSLEINTKEITYASKLKNNDDFFKVSFSRTGSNIKSKYSLDNWLTERYCFYQSQGSIKKYPINHPNWRLQQVNINQLEISTIFSSHLPVEQPVVHYAKQKHAILHPYEILKKRDSPT